MAVACYALAWTVTLTHYDRLLRLLHLAEAGCSTPSLQQQNLPAQRCQQQACSHQACAAAAACCVQVGQTASLSRCGVVKLLLLLLLLPVPWVLPGPVAGPGAAVP
jgi:hypothetical protein